MSLCCVASVAADTVVLVSLDSADSPAISSIVSGIQDRSNDLTVEYIDNLSDYDVKSAGNTEIIILGTELVEQSRNYVFSKNTIGGGFYDAVSLDIPIYTMSLLPSIDTIADEIIKTGFDLRTLTTVSSSNELKLALENSSNSLNMKSIDHIVRFSMTERGIAKAWFDVLSNLNPATDAIYISDARYIESSGAYREILENAWRNNIMVVSALPQFSRRGVSIGFLPDLNAYGNALVERGRSFKDSPASVAPTTIYSDLDMLVRVYNLRTLRKIGYTLPSDIDSLSRDDIVER